MKRMFGITSLVFSLILFASSLAQAQELVWAKQAGGITNEDIGRAIAVDGAGNSYVTGLFGGEANFDGVTLTSDDLRDIFVAKYQPDGSLAWAKQTRGGVLFGSFGIAVDNSGNSYVTGEIRLGTEFDGVTLIGDPEGDVFIAKYATDGSVVWATKAGGLGHDIGRGIAVDDSGNSYITGRFRGGATFGDIRLDAVGDADYFIAKYDPDGSVVWAKQAGGISWDEGWGITVDSFGNSYVVGTFQGSAIFEGVTLTSNGMYDTFVAKYNPDGSQAWVKQGGGTFQYMAGPAISVDSSGNSYVTGFFGGDAAFDDVTLTSRGGKDIFITKYDPDGSLLWAKQAGGTSNDAGYGISVDSSGNSYVTGYSGEAATFDDVSLPDSGGFAAKYNTDGSLDWVKQGGNVGRGIAVDGLGNIYVTGGFDDATSFDGVSLTSAGGWDIFVAKYGKETVCWPRHRGVPYDTDPPAIDGFVQEDVGWRGAQRYTYGNGTDSPHVALQTLHHSVDDYVFISFEVRNDVSFDHDDVIVLNFRPDTGVVNPANDVRIVVYPLCDNDGAAGPGCTDTTPADKTDRLPRLLEVWKNSTTWTQMTSLPTNLEARVRSYPDGTSNSWNVEIKVPTMIENGGAQWVNFRDDFLFYANVIRVTNPGGMTSEFRWPRDAPEVSGPITSYPFSPAEWGNGTKSSTATCNGVSLRISDVGTTNTPSSRIIVNPVPNTFSNTFAATVRNNTEVNGTPQQADDVHVRFRIANWGLPAPRDWEDIEVTNPGCPDATLESNPTCPDFIPAATEEGAGSKTFNLNWTVPDVDVPLYQENDHQCILVELDSLSDTNIVTKSVYRNMDFFVEASTFTRDARISANGYAPPPNGNTEQKFSIHVTKKEWATIPKPHTTVGVGRGKQVSYLTWGAHGYRHLGKDIIINGNTYEIIDPIGSFGYVVQHTGLAVEEWTDDLIGADLIHNNIYQVSVPHNGAVTVTTQIVAEEFGLLNWLTLLLLFLIILLILIILWLRGQSSL